MLPLLLIFIVFYFMLIRPQSKRAKEHRAMLAALEVGNEIATAGGIIGKVSRTLDDGEVEVEIAQNVKVRIIRAMITEVRAKGEPVTE